MASNNAINNQALNGFTASGGTISISADAAAATVDVGTGAGIKTVTLGSTNTSSSTTVRSGSTGLSINSNGGSLTMNSSTGAINISTDIAATTMNIGTGAAVKTVTLGSTNGASTTTVQAGSSGTLNITSNGGALTINSGSGTLSMSTSALPSTINIGTGAAVKTVVLGSVSSTSKTTIQAGAAPGGLFTAGVFGVTVGGTGIPVVVDNTGLLGTVVSSIRYKENIADMGSVSSPILTLRPVTFDLIGKSNPIKQVGLIAEEVYKIMPSLVVHNLDGQVESVKYHELPVLLLNEIQKALKRIDILEDKISKL